MAVPNLLLGNKPFAAGLSSNVASFCINGTLSRRRSRNRDTASNRLPRSSRSYNARYKARIWLLSSGCCSRALNTYRRAWAWQAENPIRPPVTSSMFTYPL